MTVIESSPITRVVDGTEVPVAGSFSLDSSHSHVGFSVRHLMVSKTKGRFAEVTGTVVINDAVVSAGLPEIAHGGVKASGMGRIHGEDGLLECVRTRVVVDDMLTGMRQAWWFGYGPESAARLDAYVRLSHGRSWSDRLSGIAGTIKMLLRPEKPL